MRVGLPLAIQLLEGTGLPFVVRSPHSIERADAPPWWSGKLDGKWVLTVLNHETREHMLGSGITIHDAILDLDEGFSKSESGVRLEIPPECLVPA